ncbi:hypothetical protein QQG55_55910 [Brugia pahangi]
MSSRKQKTKRAHKLSDESNKSAFVKDTIFSAHCLVENSADNIEAMIKLLKCNQKCNQISVISQEKMDASEERLSTATEKIKIYQEDKFIIRRWQLKNSRKIILLIEYILGNH